MSVLRNTFLSLTLLLTAACGKEEDGFTVVQGRVINKYTGRGLTRARVEVYQLTPNFTSMLRDSVTAGVTDSSGAYELSFNASGKSRHKYHIRIRSTDSIDDLTTYPDISAATYGIRLKKGSRNEVDFTATPYKTVTVQLTANKGGKNYLGVSCYAIDSGDSFGADIFTDTTRSNQQVSLTRTVRLLPMRTYRFIVNAGNRVRTNQSGYTLVDLGPVLPPRDRRVLYNDTTTVVLR